MGKPIQDMNLMELREEVLRADPGSQRQSCCWRAWARL